jgi:hypothetical protein
MLISVTGIFACFQLMVAAAHLRIHGVVGILKDLEVNRRILIVVDRFVDRLFRQANHGLAKPAEHPCRQTIAMRFAHSSEMRGEWSGLQEEVSIKSALFTKPDLECWCQTPRSWNYRH